MFSIDSINLLSTLLTYCPWRRHACGLVTPALYGMFIQLTRLVHICLYSNWIFHSISQMMLVPLAVHWTGVYVKQIGISLIANNNWVVAHTHAHTHNVAVNLPNEITAIELTNYIDKLPHFYCPPARHCPTQAGALSNWNNWKSSRRSSHTHTPTHTHFAY